MQKKIIISFLVACFIMLSGCASVELASQQQDAEVKQFKAPPNGKAGLYIYRNSFWGKIYRKKLTLDGKLLGKTVNKTYFYKLIDPGKHVIITESAEYGDNSMSFDAVAGKNYFVEQYLSLGAFEERANLKMVDEEVGKKNVLSSTLIEENAK